MTLSLALLLAQPERREAEACRWALAQLESGADDKARGLRGEVSRFQLMPDVWERYKPAPGWQPENERQAWLVALRVLKDRWPAFQSSFHAASVYGVWHCPGRMAAAGWSASHLPTPERALCRRFANLYARRLSELQPAPAHPQPPTQPR